MAILLALAAATAAPSCAVGSGNGYTGSLVAPPPVAAPPPKPVVVAKAKPVAKPKPKRAKLSLGCSSHKKG